MKRKIFLTDDMKFKIAAEYVKLPRGKKGELAKHYNISESSINNFVKAYKKSKSIKSQPGKRIQALLDLYRCGKLEQIEVEAAIVAVTSKFTT